MQRTLGSLLAVAGLLVMGGTAHAQTFEVLGTRAAGMGGAFVAVADDASAIYWNPAGLASGAFFSLLIDRNSERVAPDGVPEAGSSSSSIVALSTPALGVGYYRLRSTVVRPPDLSSAGGSLGTPLPALFRVETLITHHTGVTLVQSLTDGVAVAATLKLVRGVAARGHLPAQRTELLDEGGDLVGTASNAFDTDLGVMATFGRLRAGLTLRNATEPGFETSSGEELTLERQVRAGVAISPREGVQIGADLDLRRVPGPLGDVRDLAVGAEARVAPRVLVRSGFRINTADEEPGGRAAVVSVGGSYAVSASFFVDAQATAGSESGGRGWGVAGRMMF